MLKFKYIAKSLDGETFENEIEAFSKELLVRDLQDQGLFIVKIEEVQPAYVSERYQADAFQPGESKKFHHTKIKLIDVIAFARQLVTMLESGVPLLRSLHVIIEQVESKKFFNVLSTVADRVEEGSTLSDALGEHPKVFNPFWVSLVEVGETAGSLPQVLSKLSFYLEQQAAFRATIISAVIYPAILFFVCIAAISFFALFIGPRFEDVFNSMEVQLPFMTQALLASFRIMKANFWKIIGGLFAAGFIIRRYIRTKSGRAHLERFLFNLPTIGNIYRLIIVERFASQMAILVESGVPILHALDISSRLVDNSICSEIILQIKEKVRQGELLAVPMHESGFFSGMAVQMITVGEETGKLSKMLKHVAVFYQNTVETFMKRIATIIEPFILIFMGTIIGVIVFAMFMPMFNLAQLGGG